MRHLTWLVLGSASALAWAAGCGSGDSPFTSGAAGSDSGTAASGGSGGGSSGASSGGSSGSSSGGSSGSSSGGSAGMSTGGSAGMGTGGGAGSAGTGGSAGSTGTGGSAGVDAGTGGSAGMGTGGSAGIGTGGSAGMGTGGSAGADACVPVTWCQDEDHDTYGKPTGMVTSCTAPGPHWIAAGSKARACEDCNDANINVHPNSNYCDGKGYAVDAGGVSFDFNCDGSETECGNPAQKADPNGCHLSSGGATLCAGSGYLPTARTGSAQNAYCGSTTYRKCSASVGTVDSGVCAEETFTNYNPITCK